MLRRAWTGPTADRLESVLAGDSVPLAPAEVLGFLDEASQRLQDAGFDVLAPGELGRTRSVRRRLRSASTGSGALSVESLGLAADVTIDGQSITAQELAALVSAKSELVGFRGR